MNNNNENIIHSFLSIKSIIGLSFSFICLYFLYNNFNWILFVKHIRNTNYLYLSISILCIFLSLVVRAFRWRLFFYDKVSLFYLYKSETLGYWGNSLFPMRIGELIKIHYAKKTICKSYSYILSTVVFERLVDMIFILPFIFIFYFIFPMDIVNDKIRFLILLSPLLLLMLFLFSIYYSRLKIFLKKNISTNFIVNINLNKFFIIFSTILIWLLVLLDVYFVQLSMNLNFSFYDNISVMLLATIIYVFPSSPGSIGTFHLGIQEFMVRFLEYPTDVSIAFAFILHAHSYLFFILLGTWYFSRDTENILSFKGKHEIH